MAFGEILKQKRLEYGWTREYIAERMNMRTCFVEMLETENLKRIVAPAYGRGYIRNYCRELGIDSKPLEADYNALLAAEGRAEPAVLDREAVVAERLLGREAAHFLARHVDDAVRDREDALRVHVPAASAEKRVEVGEVLPVEELARAGRRDGGGVNDGGRLRAGPGEDDRQGRETREEEAVVHAPILSKHARARHLSGRRRSG